MLAHLLQALAGVLREVVELWPLVGLGLIRH
jgi:hypothetical protein